MDIIEHESNGKIDFPEPHLKYYPYLLLIYSINLEVSIEVY